MKGSWKLGCLRPPQNPIHILEAHLTNSTSSSSWTFCLVDRDNLVLAYLANYMAALMRIPLFSSSSHSRWRNLRKTSIYIEFWQEIIHPSYNFNSVFYHIHASRPLLHCNKISIRAERGNVVYVAWWSTIQSLRYLSPPVKILWELTWGRKAAMQGLPAGRNER